MMQLKRFIVLPAYGFKSPALAAATVLRAAGPVVQLAGRAGKGPDTEPSHMRVIDSLYVDGPKLVEMTDEAELDLRTAVPGLKIVPLVEYHKQRAEVSVRRTFAEASGAATAKADRSISAVAIRDGSTGLPLPAARVIAFTDFRNRIGDMGDSDANGRVKLRIPEGTQLQRLYVYGPDGYWGRYAVQAILSRGLTIDLTAIDLGSTEGLLARFTGRIPMGAGQGVTVGIVDSGVARDHPSLPRVQGGANLVLEETRDEPGAVDDWGPAQVDGSHGTHVAGIVAGTPGLRGGLFRGVAPAAAINSYRVFPHSGGSASNYDIMKAIDRAVADGCDIVNLSLGGGEEDEAVRAAIGQALDRGTLVVAAAGNDGRRQVSFPGALNSTVAVSAAGRRGSFPADSTEQAEFAKPTGKPDREWFLAGFSNFGPQIDLTGPGLGIVSTVPDDGYAVMSGTSMACPAVAGFAAYVLSSSAAILNLRGADRSTQLKTALYARASELGFGRWYEGFGLPEPE